MNDLIRKMLEESIKELEEEDWFIREVEDQYNP